MSVCAGCGAEFMGESPADCLHGALRPFDLEVQVGAAIYDLLQRFGAQSDLLGVVGSWASREITDREFLVYMRAYNGPIREAA